MEVGDRKTKAGGGLESSTRGVHFDCWGCKGIVRRKHQGTPILTIVVWSVRRTSENVMPSRLEGKYIFSYLRGMTRTYSKILDSDG